MRREKREGLHPAPILQLTGPTPSLALSASHYLLILREPEALRESSSPLQPLTITPLPSERREEAILPLPNQARGEAILFPSPERRPPLFPYHLPERCCPLLAPSWRRPHTLSRGGEKKASPLASGEERERRGEEERERRGPSPVSSYLLLPSLYHTSLLSPL